MAERGDDAVQEGFAADEAMVGQQVGAIGEMLPAAEADLEMQGAVVAEQAGGGDLSLLRDGVGGEQGVDQLLLHVAEIVPGLAAVEAVVGGGLARHMHCSVWAGRGSYGMG